MTIRNIFFIFCLLFLNYQYLNNNDNNNNIFFNNPYNKKFYLIEFPFAFCFMYYLIPKILNFIESKIYNINFSIKNIYNKNINNDVNQTKNQIILNDEEKKRLAIHEAGHALILCSQKTPFEFIFATIIPQMQNNIITCLGFNNFQYKTEHYFLIKKEILIIIGMYLAGRAAEDLILNSISYNAKDDLIQATEIAKNMITEYGFGKEMSNAKNNKDLNDEINEIIENEYQKVTLFLIQHKVLLLKITEEFIKNNTLYKEEIEKIIIEYEKTNNIKLEYQ